MNFEERIATNRIGDRLSELYALHAESAGRLAYLLVGDADLAEDLVQDAFVRVSARLSSLRRPEAFEAYLKRTIINLSKAHTRRMIVERKNRGRSYHLGSSEDAVDLSDRDAVLRALKHLPHRQKTAIVLRYYEDLSEQQVADLMRCPVGTVKSLVFRAMSNLRKELEGND